jgi:hypothetical protein
MSSLRIVRRASSLHKRGDFTWRKSSEPGAKTLADEVPVVFINGRKAKYRMDEQNSLRKLALNYSASPRVPPCGKGSLAPLLHLPFNFQLPHSAFTITPNACTQLYELPPFVLRVAARTPADSAGGTCNRRCSPNMAAWSTRRGLIPPDSPRKSLPSSSPTPGIRHHYHAATLAGGTPPFSSPYRERNPLSTGKPSAAFGKAPASGSVSLGASLPRLHHAQPTYRL